MAIGTAVAKGANADVAAKIVTGKGLSLREIVDASIEEYTRETSESEITESKSRIDAGVEETEKAAIVYGLHVSPLLVNPIATEESIIVSLGENLELAGRPDYITEDGLGDLKTGQPWTQERADRARQLTAYSLLHYGRLGSWPKRVWIDSIGKSGNKWAHARLWSCRTDDNRSAYVEIMRRVQSGMAHGVYLPAPEGAWWCSESWCSYWKICPVVQ